VFPQNLMAGEPLYTVEGIEVDVTDENAVKAREEAFKAAQIKGYEVLAQRVLEAEELANFNVPEFDVISSYVQDYEVTNEQLAPTRYKGVYKITFSPNAFSNNGFAGDGSAGEHMAGQPDLLILPFFDMGGGRTILWQANPFMAAWVRARAGGMAGRAIIPIGDIEDAQAVRDYDALRYDPAKVNAMRLRYQAREAAILLAKSEPLGNGARNIMVGVYNVHPYGPELARQISVRGFSGELTDQLFNRVVTQVAQFLNQNWQRQTAVSNVSSHTGHSSMRAGQYQSITAQFDFSAPRQWVQTKQTLERLPEVKQVAVQSLAARRAILRLDFYGDVYKLGEVLQRAGLGLREISQPTNYTYTAPRHVGYQLYTTGRVQHSPSYAPSYSPSSRGPVYSPSVNSSYQDY
ncbi:MAG: DUF2066 domain-containing protein, partial [Alphaproteobacteria bacterium]|nr:DUF2066 domain-containing protein [Alphaproteobacteria bacterium]